MTATRLLVVQHEDQCPPAWFGEWLTDAGCELDLRRPYAGESLPGDLDGHAGLFVLGGSMGAYDDEQHPWLGEVKQLFRAAAATRTPALGICLGHQLAAVALGGAVARHPHGQRLGLATVGWLPEAAADPLCASSGLPGRGAQWNSDVVCEPPPGTAVLARAGEDVQVARFATTVWGVQLHPEVDDTVVGPWAAHDRPLHPEGTVDRALAEIAAAREELEAGWRPLATAFGRLVTEESSHRRNTDAP